MFSIFIILYTKKFFNKEIQNNINDNNEHSTLKEIYDKIMISIDNKEDLLPHLTNHKNVFYKMRENQENAYNGDPVMNVINNQPQNPGNYNHSLHSSSTSSNIPSNNLGGSNSDISMYNLSENHFSLLVKLVI